MAFGAVVAGIIGSYLDNHPPSGTLPRFIYTVVVAGISMLVTMTTPTSTNHGIGRSDTNVADSTFN